MEEEEVEGEDETIKKRGRENSRGTQEEEEM